MSQRESTGFRFVLKVRPWWKRLFWKPWQGATTEFYWTDADTDRTLVQDWDWYRWKMDADG
jgi:hypothetical protein